MSENETYVQLMDESIKNIFKSASRIVLKDPAQAYFLLKTVRRQRKAARVRQKWREGGLRVPPFLFISVTHRCNLKCEGCFPRANQRLLTEEMTDGKLKSVIEEAGELGISFIFLVGGEPLVRQGILNITKDFPEIIFPLFTNGLFIDEELLTKLKDQKNVVPVISLEGYEKDTDERRGNGVYGRLQGVLKRMTQRNIFFGLSFTITSSNLETVTGDGLIEHFLDSGCKLFFFVEYVPAKQGPESLVLTGEQRDRLIKLTYKFRSQFPGLFFVFPGDEEKFGGCLSAGRGFVHINPGGYLEPCPFVPYSDTNLMDVSLSEALQSQFLREIRKNREQLKRRQGGCTLWEKREWVRSLLK